MTNTQELDSPVRCWDENCASEDVEHRWLADPTTCRNLDEWKCRACGFRWARWSEPEARS